MHDAVYLGRIDPQDRYLVRHTCSFSVRNMVSARVSILADGSKYIPHEHALVLGLSLTPALM
jgi:hypothetical protein